MICSKQVLLHANDLLDQKLLENGHFQPAYKSGSVFSALYEITKIASLTIQNRDVKISFDFGQVRERYPVLMFDKRRVQQVLYNLLSNAVKFTRKGEITVSGSVIPKEDDPGLFVLTVSVEDQGIGMTDEDKERIFDEFKESINLANRTLNPYSNRIGLSFCKRICQAFDGNISVVSVLG